MIPSIPDLHLPDRASPEANRRADIVSGAIVALIALPLCLGIASASGVPAVAGLLTSIVAGVVATWFGSAPLTIKGPAAGLISVCAACVADLGDGDPIRGYRALLAVTVVVGLVQVLLGKLRLGRFGKAFPPSVIHGMLAAIGIVIVVRQSYVLLGIDAGTGGTLALAARLPLRVVELNPAVATVGVVALLVLLGWPRLAVRLPTWARLPAPLAALVATIPTAQWLGFGHQHAYTLAGWAHRWSVGPRQLVDVPAALHRAVVMPSVAALSTPAAWWYVALFLFIGSVESLLTARAIDGMDPWHRNVEMDNDLVAVGLGNAVAGLVGGLPMISEVVRSTANVAHGAHSRFANFVHGLLLLAVVALAPGVLGLIPLAALAGMLVLTGVRLASPRELLAVARIGPVQLTASCATVAATLAVDLLAGVCVGLAVEIGAVAALRARPKVAFAVHVQAEGASDNAVALAVEGPMCFSSLPAFDAALRPFRERDVRVDLSRATIVDHSTMVELAATRRRMAARGRSFGWSGLERHVADSRHPLASRHLSVTAA